MEKEWMELSSVESLIEKEKLEKVLQEWKEKGSVSIGFFLKDMDSR